MPPASTSPLAAIEPRLRNLLSADLYAMAWVDPSPANLNRVFEHLRALQRILYDYVPRHVSESPPSPGQVRHGWQEGTLMFTDMAGFTPLMEANAAKGAAGAESLLGVLNAYFAEMLEIISKSGGNLLEFTGDALLAQFPANERGTDTAQAVRAGLRMQRAMKRFQTIETDAGTLSLGMRVGLHTGRFMAADIGTPRRMEHILLGAAVQTAKRSEGAGEKGRVCLTEVALERVKDEFRYEPGKPGHFLIVDDLADDQLGEYDIATSSRRPPSMVLMDRSVEGLTAAIENAVNLVEPLSCYLPDPVLNLVVESAARRRIVPDFPRPVVMFVNLIGLPESIDGAQPEEAEQIIASFSRVFAMINAAVETRGGLLKKVTYHTAGSDIVIYFGAPSAHTNDAARAADAALAIREIITSLIPPTVGGKQVTVECQLGLNQGNTFAAEIGEPRGRREFNVLGDTVNTAARLMSRAVGNRILLSETIFGEIHTRFKCDSLGKFPLKGKAAPVPMYALRGPAQS